MQNYFIYKITNIVNNKYYIGFTKNPEMRILDHLRISVKSNYLLHRAIRKYGKDNFIFEIIYESKDAEYTLKIMEPFYIKKFNSHYIEGYGYNMTYGGEGLLGYKHSDETKLKISKLSTGRKHTEEAKLKIARPGKLNPWYGKSPSEETKKKMSDAHKGKPAAWTQNLDKLKEIGKKISDIKKVNNPGGFKAEKDYLITFSDNTKKAVKNMKKFCEENGYLETSIHAILKGRTKTHKNIVKVEKL